MTSSIYIFIKYYLNITINFEHYYLSNTYPFSSYQYFKHNHTMPNTSSGSFFGHYYIVMEAV